MQRLRFIDPENARGTAKTLYQQLVMVPNIFGVIANSEAVLDTFASYRSNLDGYKLSQPYRKMISLAVSQHNECGYCLALHHHQALEYGILDRKACMDARRMASPDAKANALLSFTRQVLENHGNVDNDALAAVSEQGFDDQEIIEMVAVIANITMANYIANIARPDPDFLKAPPLED